MNGIKDIFSRGLAIIFCAALLSAASMPAVALAPAPEERMGIAGPIKFGDESYRLAWTSHPSPVFYKQEYLTAGQSPERYDSMLMIDFIASGTTVAESAQAMVHSLEARKENDPLVNYDMIVSEAGDQIILDFVLSAAGADGQMILEWNAYRYSVQGSGVRMVGISRRVYGDDVAPFLKNELRTVRARDIDLLSKLTLPAIRIAAP